MIKKIGLSVLGLLVLLILIYVFFANTLIKTIAEHEIGKAHGAEANIADVDHTLVPLTITINGVELTDAHSPSRNQIQVGTIQADVEFAPLLSQKIVLDNVLIDQVAFNQARTNNGAVFRPPGPSLQDILSGLPSKEDIPSKEDLLARSALQTPGAVAAAKATQAQYLTPLKTQYESLPNKADIENYKTQFKALQKTDYKNPAALLNAKQTWDTLKQSMQADKVKIKAFKTLASKANAALKSNIADLNAAPKADYALMQNLIAGDSDALSQITQMVFGAKAQQFNTTLLTIINTIAPMLAPAPDAPPVVIDPNATYPNLLVRQATVNLAVAGQVISSEWQNITDQHVITKTPTTFALNASTQQNSANALWEQLSMQGDFSILPEGVNAFQQWDIAGLVLENLPVSNDPRLNAIIKQAALFSKGEVRMQNNTIAGAAEFLFDQLALEAQGNDKYAQIIAQTLNTLDTLNVKTTYSGELNAPVLSLKSDLDNRLGKALMQGILSDQSGPLSDLRQELQAQAAEGLGIAQGDLSQVTLLLQLANGDLSSLDSLLSSELGGKEQLKNKLLDKLKGKFLGD